MSDQSSAEERAEILPCNCPKEYGHVTRHYELCNRTLAIEAIKEAEAAAADQREREVRAGVQSELDAAYAVEDRVNAVIEAAEAWRFNWGLSDMDALEAQEKILVAAIDALHTAREEGT